MQTSAPATRISTAAHGNHPQLNLVANQLVISSLRLTDFSLTALGPTWALPTTAYSIVNVASGDRIKKTVSMVDYYWDLGYENLGVQIPVTLPDSTTHTCAVSSAVINANEDLICFYGASFRSIIPAPYGDDGIYVMRVFDDGAGHLYWGHPITVVKHARDVVNGTTFFVSFPRIQIINGEYWILALECSLFAGVTTYHLCYFRSADGEHWSDREYLTGVSTDSNEQNTGINSYLSGSTPTAFVKADLLDGYLSISTNSTYIVSNGGLGNFVCASTALVGITNTAKQLDITAYNNPRDLTLPRAPSAGHGSYTIGNPGGIFTNHALLDATHEDMLVIHKEGYHTTDAFNVQRDDLVTLAIEALDNVDQETQIGNNKIIIGTQDLAYRLNAPYTEYDLFREFEGPKQVALSQICDLTSLSVQEGGQFDTNTSGELICHPVDASNVTTDDWAFFLERVAREGGLELEFSVGHRQWGGILFQGVDEQHAWAAFYNDITGKIQLSRAVPTAAGHHRIRKYDISTYSSSLGLSINTWYHLRVQLWRQTAVIDYSTDGITWINAITYTNILLPTKKAYWGVVGRSQAKSGQIVGNTSAKGGAQDLSDGASNPTMKAIRIQTGANAGYLRKIPVIMAQLEIPAQARIGLGEDNGAGTAPADLTDDSNVVWEGSYDAINFNNPNSPGWGWPNVEGKVRVQASTYYWVFVTFNDVLTGGQAWNWFTQDTSAPVYTAGPTVTSSNNGATWGSTAANTALTAYAVIDYDGNYAKFKNINWTSGEVPQTLETLLQHTASSGNILTSVMDDAPAGALLGDCLISTDVNLSGTAGVTLRGASGYKIEFIPSGQQIKFYANSVAISTLESLAYLPTGIVIHIAAGMWNGFLYAFVNGVLAASHYDNSITTTGVVGHYGSGTFTNFRVPDLTAMYDYFVLNDGEAPQQALDKLVGQPTSKHHPQRVHWFINYLGSFRATSGDNPTVADTYDSSVTGLKITGKKRTRRFSIGQWLPQGNYYATRWFAAILKRVGRRVKHADYATGASDAQAYADAENPMREAEEQAEQFSIEAVANYALEREDVIAVIDAPTGTNGDYLITDLDFKYSGVEKADPMMTVGLRQVIP